MAFASTPSQRQVAEINITPLVDVMLVLLVIFMVATPMLTQRIGLDLPQRTPHATETPNEIDLRIDAAGGVWWNGAPSSLAALPAQLASATQADRPPLLRVDANAQADYGVVAKVIALARNAGIERIGMVQPH